MKIGRVKKKQFQISFSNVILRTMLRSSSISAMRWPELVKNNFHITTRFCKDDLDSTSHSKKPNFSNGIWIWMKLHVCACIYHICDLNNENENIMKWYYWDIPYSSQGSKWDK
jgi:hypothetical protein